MIKKTFTLDNYHIQKNNNHKWANVMKPHQGNKRQNVSQSV